MKNKILLFISLFILVACQPRKQILHVFYSSTCSECKLLEKEFIPEIKNLVEIEMHDIDQIQSVYLYQTYLDNLVNVDSYLYENPMTPFIYMEDGFGAVGYIDIMKDIYIELITNEINDEVQKNLPSGIWLCKED